MDVNKLWKEVKGLCESDTPPDSKTVQRISDLLSQIQAAREEAGSLAEFFEAVGDAYVKAQEKLDLTSEAYNRDTSQAAMFRIPKVSASFSFMASSVKGSGFNVFFASSKDQQEEHQQQQISFEIVAVPPPPEKLRELQTQPLQFIVLNRAERAKWKELILKQRPEWESEYDGFVLLKRRSARLAVFLSLGAENVVEKMAILGLLPEQPESEPINAYHWSVNGTEKLAALADFFAGIFELQRTLLREE